MSWFASSLLSAFLMPPFSVILLGATGFLLLRRRPRLGKLMVFSALALLYLLSIPFVAEALLQRLETPPERGPFDNDVQAIVVLGGGTYYQAPEYGNDTVGRYSLQRIRYAAELHRRTVAARANPSWRRAALLWEASHPKRRK